MERLNNFLNSLFAQWFSSQAMPSLGGIWQNMTFLRYSRWSQVGWDVIRPFVSVLQILVALMLAITSLFLLLGVPVEMLVIAPVWIPVCILIDFIRSAYYRRWEFFALSYIRKETVESLGRSFWGIALGLQSILFGIVGVIENSISWLFIIPRGLVTLRTPSPDWNNLDERIKLYSLGFEPPVLPVELHSIDKGFKLLREAGLLQYRNRMAVLSCPDDAQAIAERLIELYRRYCLTDFARNLLIESRFARSIELYCFVQLIEGKIYDEASYALLDQFDYSNLMIPFLVELRRSCQDDTEYCRAVQRVDRLPKGIAFLREEKKILFLIKDASPHFFNCVLSQHALQSMPSASFVGALGQQFKFLFENQLFSAVNRTVSVEHGKDGATAVHGASEIALFWSVRHLLFQGAMDDVSFIVAQYLYHDPRWDYASLYKTRTFGPDVLFSNDNVPSMILKRDNASRDVLTMLDITREQLTNSLEDLLKSGEHREETVERLKEDIQEAGFIAPVGEDLVKAYVTAIKNGRVQPGYQSVLLWAQKDNIPLRLWKKSINFIQLPALPVEEKKEDHSSAVIRDAQDKRIKLILMDSVGDVSSDTVIDLLYTNQYSPNPFYRLQQVNASVVGLPLEIEGLEEKEEREDKPEPVVSSASAIEQHGLFRRSRAPSVEIAAAPVDARSQETACSDSSSGLGAIAAHA